MIWFLSLACTTTDVPVVEPMPTQTSGPSLKRELESFRTYLGLMGRSQDDACDAASAAISLSTRMSKALAAGEDATGWRTAGLVIDGHTVQPDWREFAIATNGTEWSTVFATTGSLMFDSPTCVEPKRVDSQSKRIPALTRSNTCMQDLLKPLFVKRYAAYLDMCTCSPVPRDQALNISRRVAVLDAELGERFRQWRGPTCETGDATEPVKPPTP